MTAMALKFLLVLLMASGLTWPLNAQEGAPRREPEAVVRDFDRWYLQSLAAKQDPFAGEQTELKAYVTSRLLGEIDKARRSEDGISSDPFLAVQDFDKGWARKVSASRPVIQGDVATTDVTMNGPEMGTHKLTVKLRQEAGAWKLDAVKGP